MTASKARQESRAGAFSPEQGGGYKEDRKGKSSIVIIFLYSIVAYPRLHKR